MLLSSGALSVLASVKETYIGFNADSDPAFYLEADPHPGLVIAIYIFVFRQSVRSACL
jgi:hypothetical protein